MRSPYWLLLVLILLLAGLQYRLWVGDGSLAQVTELKRQIAEQQGMFSLLPLKEADVLSLRKYHGIYMPTSGRINIAGLKASDIAAIAKRRPIS